MNDTYDVVVIGAGPGGYVSAIRAAQLGLKVAIIEKRGNEGPKAGSKAVFGGTCLNVGCIPSKALLDSSEHYHNAVHNFAEHGIKLKESPTIDVSAMLKRQSKIVGNLTGGIDYLMKKNKISTFYGTGSLIDANNVLVSTEAGETQSLAAKNIILAMGSVPVELPFMPNDGACIVSSTEALRFDEVPKQLVVVGGGVIGLELGSVWARLGSEVTVIEFLDNIAAGYEADVCKALQKSLEAIGMTFHLSTKVTGCTTKNGVATVSAETKDGKPLSFPANKVLIAVGRRPLSESASIENAGVQLDERKRIIVNDKFQTSCPNIYAIGDLVEGPMLAHKAEEEGVAVAENIAGKHGHVDHNLIPKVVYTWPELSSVGKDITELKN